MDARVSITLAHTPQSHADCSAVNLHHSCCQTQGKIQFFLPALTSHSINFSSSMQATGSGSGTNSWRCNMPIGSHAKVTEEEKLTKIFANWVCFVSCSDCFAPRHSKQRVYKTFSWKQRISAICKLLVPGAEIQTQYLKCPCFVSGFLCGNAIILYNCSLGCSSMTSRDKPCCCQRRGPSFPVLLAAFLHPYSHPWYPTSPSWRLFSPLRVPVHLLASAGNYFLVGLGLFFWAVSCSFRPLNWFIEDTLGIRRAQENSKSSGQAGRSRRTPLQQQWAIGKATLILLQP